MHTSGVCPADKANRPATMHVVTCIQPACRCSHSRVDKEGACRQDSRLLAGFFVKAAERDAQIRCREREQGSSSTAHPRPCHTGRQAGAEQGGCARPALNDLPPA